MVEGLGSLLALEGARRVEFRAPGEVLLQFLSPVSLPVLLTPFMAPAQFFLGFFLFLRPPAASPGAMALPPAMVGPLLCCFYVRSLELPRKIPIFLEFWKIEEKYFCIFSSQTAHAQLTAVCKYLSGQGN